MRFVLMLGALVIVLWLTLKMIGGGGDAQPDTRETDAAPPKAAPGAQLQAANLRVAVAAATANADCGYSQVGFGHSTPEEAAQKLVQTMQNSSGEQIQYRLGEPSAPWQVVIRPAPDESKLYIEGYASNTAAPQITQYVPCQ